MKAVFIPSEIMLKLCLALFRGQFGTDHSFFLQIFCSYGAGFSSIVQSDNLIYAS